MKEVNCFLLKDLHILKSVSVMACLNMAVTSRGYIVLLIAESIFKLNTVMTFIKTMSLSFKTKVFLAVLEVICSKASFDECIMLPT